MLVKRPVHADRLHFSSYSYSSCCCLLRPALCCRRHFNVGILQCVLALVYTSIDNNYHNWRFGGLNCSAAGDVEREKLYTRNQACLGSFCFSSTHSCCCAVSASVCVTSPPTHHTLHTYTSSTSFSRHGRRLQQCIAVSAERQR